MKLPEKVRVGISDYEIKLIDMSLVDAIGYMNYVDTTVKLSNKLSDSRLKEVLAHELVHTMLYEAGYEDSEDHDEELINALGKVLAMMLRDNDFTFMRDNGINY